MSFLPFDHDPISSLRGHADHIVTALSLAVAVAAIVFLALNPGIAPSVRAW